MGYSELRHVKHAGSADKEEAKSNLETFKSRFGVDSQTKGTVCVGRLLNGQCPQYRNPDHPHQIPHKDHTSLWLRDGDPEVYAAHLYDLPHEYARDILDFAEEHGLRVTFDGTMSWYWPGHATGVYVTNNRRGD